MFLTNIFLSAGEVTENITGTTIVGSDTTTNDAFGSFIAVARNGDYMVVCAPTDDGTAMDQGSAYVFVWSGSAWEQQEKLIASDPAASDWFGTAVAINAAGDTIAVGAMYDDGTFTDQGSVYIFTRGEFSWSQQAKLTPSDPVPSGGFGRSVSLSDDGNTLLVGSDSGTGAAFVFTRSGTSWSQQAKLTSSESIAGGRFGVSVDLSQDGNTAVIGAFLANRAYTYTRSGSTWTEQYILVPSAGDQTGMSVAISGNGTRCFLGSPGNKKVFVFDSGTEVAAIVDTYGGYGTSVDTTTDGLSLLVGAPTYTVGTQTHGAMKFLTSVTASSWNIQYEDIVINGDYFGNRLAMDGHGTRLIIGHNTYTGGGRAVSYTRTII